MKTAISKMTGVMLMAAGLIAGCATQPKPEPEAAPPAAEQPAPPPAVTAPPPEEPAAPAQTTYTVQRGDNLWNIAGQADIYGNAYYWPLIFRANTDKIRDADLIYPRQVLNIDRNPSSADINAAVTHAKTRGAWSLGVVEESDKAFLAR